MEEVLTIGRLAKLTGLSVSAIRFYEQKGLMQAPPRNKSGYRVYPSKMVEKVSFIKSCRDLDFPIPTISELLNLCYPQDDAIDCNSVQQRIRKRLETVQQQLDVLDEQRQKLERMLYECNGEGSCGQGCGFVRILLEHSPG